MHNFTPVKYSILIFVLIVVFTACRSYYFLEVDSTGKVWHYPVSGSFSTYGESTCASNYSN